MTNFERGKFLTVEALQCYKDLQSALESQAWNMAVRRAQEVVELSLKALLKILGLEYPKAHDVAPMLARALAEKGIEMAQGQMEEIKVVSELLAKSRGPAFYGERVFTEQEAQEAKAGAEKVLTFARELARRLEKPETRD